MKQSNFPQSDFEWINVNDENNYQPTERIAGQVVDGGVDGGVDRVVDESLNNLADEQQPKLNFKVRLLEWLFISVLLIVVVGYVAHKEIQANEAQTASESTSEEAEAEEIVLLDLEVDQTVTTALAVPFRTKRLYQKTTKGWIPIKPSSIFWGAKRSLDTIYFSIEYHAPDALAVEALAVNLDAFYVSLHQQVGLPIPLQHERLTIKVLPTNGYRQQKIDPFESMTTVVVSSPTFVSIPIPLTGADILKADIRRNLATLTLFRKVAPASPKEWWNNPAIQGVLRWLLDPEVELPTFSFRQYAGRQTAEAWFARHPTSKLSEIPVQTLPMDHYVTNTEWIENHYIPELEHQEMVIQHLVDYGLSTYGEKHLPALIESISRHENWSEIVSEVFDVSPETFEAGWHRYLRQIK